MKLGKSFRPDREPPNQKRKVFICDHGYGSVPRHLIYWWEVAVDLLIFNLFLHSFYGTSIVLTRSSSCYNQFVWSGLVYLDARVQVSSSKKGSPGTTGMWDQKRDPSPLSPKHIVCMCRLQGFGAHNNMFKPYRTTGRQGCGTNKEE
jgi:hypothetical protein